MTGCCNPFTRRNYPLRTAVLLAVVVFLTFHPTPACAERAAHAKTIHFTRNSRRAVVSGSVGNGVNPTYYFRARAGQRLTLAFQQPKGAGLVLSWSIMFPSGKTFGTKGYAPFPGRLTETGTYKIVVGRNNMASTIGKGTFHMTLSLRSANRGRHFRPGLPKAR